MSSQTPKSTLRSVDKAEFLITSTRAQNPLVSDRLALVLGAAPGTIQGPAPPTPAGGDVPFTSSSAVADEAARRSWEELQERHAQHVEAANAKLLEADRLHKVHRTQLKQLRGQRKTQTTALERRHRDLRSSFTGAYGPDVLELVGLEKPLPRAYAAARDQAKVVVARMRNPELVPQLPAPRPGQAPLDLDFLADQHEQEVATLERLTAEILETKKEAEAAIVAKKDVADEHRRTYVNVARIQEGYYRLAGFDDLADRIRTATPSPRPRTSEPALDPSGDSDSEPGSVTSAEPDGVPLDPS